MTSTNGSDGPGPQAPHDELPDLDLDGRLARIVDERLAIWPTDLIERIVSRIIEEKFSLFRRGLEARIDRRFDELKRFIEAELAHAALEDAGAEDEDLDGPGDDDDPDDLDDERKRR